MRRWSLGVDKHSRKENEEHRDNKKETHYLCINDINI